MDSMGWVLFRQGKLPEALKTLETAYGIKADPEIAAHIGEVLWTLGRKEEASRVMLEAAKKFPDSDILASALKKFQP
jgi:predicted negative regulator of RcsB-dependent stress response